jgi:serine/threonine protein phosphatase PrpC
LWNYCSPAPSLKDLVLRTAADNAGDPLRTAAALVDWANAQGGMDNITVALARLNPPSRRPGLIKLNSTPVNLPLNLIRTDRRA